MTPIGWRCATCGATLGIDALMPWRCPRSSSSDRHHVLHLVRSSGPLVSTDDVNPFVAFDAELAWAAFADRRGMRAEERGLLVRAVDDQVAQVAGTGFRVTPFGRADELSAALGFAPEGGVWVKDETGNVAGSHKARHLLTILLHLQAAEELGLAPWASPSERPSLAIASCGNAALAAATLAAAVRWPILVFVPPWGEAAVLARLSELGAQVQVCPRLDTDPPGDPCIHRFREAVDSGALPFSVQGPENALCLDGGRTLGWEIALQARADPAVVSLDRVFVQVGGGAFAASVGTALQEAGMPVAFHPVQTAGCAPLARAWERARSLPGGVADAGAHWSECMWPWEDEPRSVADGILDDETYDWLGVLSAMDANRDVGRGWPVVSSEQDVVRAYELAASSTHVTASATGTTGLAGLLTARHQVADDEQVVVVLSGVQR